MVLILSNGVWERELCCFWMKQYHATFGLKQFSVWQLRFIQRNMQDLFQSQSSYPWECVNCNGKPMLLSTVVHCTDRDQQAKEHGNTSGGWCNVTWDVPWNTKVCTGYLNWPFTSQHIKCLIQHNLHRADDLRVKAKHGAGKHMIWWKLGFVRQSGRECLAWDEDGKVCFLQSEVTIEPVKAQQEVVIDHNEHFIV